MTEEFVQNEPLTDSLWTRPLDHFTPKLLAETELRCGSRLKDGMIIRKSEIENYWKRRKSGKFEDFAKENNGGIP